jgi:hypothetical protein
MFDTHLKNITNDDKGKIYITNNNLELINKIQPIAKKENFRNFWNNEQNNIYIYYDKQKSYITSPQQGEIWLKGATMNITWTLNNILGADIRITLWKNNKYYTTIINNTANNGKYSWIIPNSLPTSSEYKLKMISNSNDLIYVYSIGYFTVK